MATRFQFSIENRTIGVAEPGNVPDRWYSISFRELQKPKQSGYGLRAGYTSFISGGNSFHPDYDKYRIVNFGFDNIASDTSYGAGGILKVVDAIPNYENETLRYHVNKGIGTYNYQLNGWFEVEPRNTAPQIAFNSGQGLSTEANQIINVGDKNEPFSYRYTVTDKDNDSLTVRTYLNGDIKSTKNNISSGTSMTLAISDQDFTSLAMDRTHDLKISASDADEISTAIIRFRKTNEAPQIKWKSGQGLTGGINASQDLGARNEAFSYTYQVSDPEGREVRVTTTLSSDSVGSIVLSDTVNAQQNTDLIASVSASNLQKFPINEQIKLEIKADDGYITSRATLTFIRTNEPPVITTDRDTYQDVEGKLNISYNVSDPNDDDIEVKWFINGSNIEAGKASFSGDGSHQGKITMDHKDFINIEPGKKNTVRIEATDDKGSMGAKTIYFYRKVGKLHVRGKFNSPMIDTAIEELYATCIMAYSEGAKVTIRMCNNVNDENPEWEDVTVPILTRQMVNFVNRTKTAGSYGIGFELIIEQGEAPDNWTAWFASMGASLPAPQD